ncbi:GNAT family N-acetyltransferase [Patulibacter sp.]|uniref:GNAT family N-acetyltransferase n=1 Tax=Patulibacter sp. TaxID=1912859 RepID=UPI0027186987|nr:GNAT family N-acetyltransferase [Patulibacter sp.]MDO9408913.1 GNAT family N-acetyltransferase [Patulibacter sp.]
MSALPPSSGAPHAGPAGPGTRLVELEPRHHAEVLELNARDVDKLAPMDEDRLRWIAARATAPLVVEDDDGVLGFCLAVPHGTDFDGRYYAWFGERYASYLYLDRIVVADRARRRGVGTMLYAACEDRARPLGRMLCEVNVVPLNAPSMAFHGSRGYAEVGRIEVGPESDPGSKVVAALAKELGG